MFSCYVDFLFVCMFVCLFVLFFCFCFFLLLFVCFSEVRESSVASRVIELIKGLAS